MKRVGVRHFRDKATHYLAGDEVLVVERRGQPVGLYIPTCKSQQENFEQAVEQLEQTVQRILRKTGLSKDDLSRLYELNDPLPESSIARGHVGHKKSDSRALGR